MNDLNLIQISVNLILLRRFYQRLWGRGSLGLSDPEYLIKTALTETFTGVSAIRPWRIQHFGEGGTAVIVGYSTADANAARRMIGDALPELSAAFDYSSVFSRTVREFDAGERLLIHARFRGSRMVRTRDGLKKEVDLPTVDRNVRERIGLAPRDDGEIYLEFFGKCLDPSAALSDTRILGLTQKVFANKDGDRKPSITTQYPVVEVSTTATVRSSRSFRSLLTEGFGRGKAFGFGMVLVRGTA